MSLTAIQPEVVNQKRAPVAVYLFAFHAAIAGIILITIGYSLFSFLPRIHRNIDLLHDLSAKKVRTLRMESDLQLLLQANRSRFLTTLAASPELASNDAAIAELSDRITAVDSENQPLQRAFQVQWQQYIAQRDHLIQATQANPALARQQDPALAESSFLAALDTVHSAEMATDTAAASHALEATQAFASARRELFIVIFIKLGVLALLGWMDSRRRRVEAALHRTAHDLRTTEESFRRAFDSAMVGMGIFKLDGTILSVNRKGASMLGREPNELVGTSVGDFMAPEYRQQHLQQIAALAAGPETSYVAERRVLRKDGGATWVRNSVTLMRPEGEEGYYFSISEEITAQKEAHDRLAWLASHDPITQLPNRSLFEEQLAIALQPGVGQSSGVALIYLEIDSFEFLKGTFGRAVADEILNDLGIQLRAFQSQDEFLGRLDDNTFGMLIPAVPYDEAAMNRAGELRDLFHRTSELGKHRIPLSASIGIAYSNDADAAESAASHDSMNAADTLLQYARAAMVEARSRGGDSICLADPALQERAAQRHRIEAALLRGLRHDEFRVVFQPQFKVADGSLVRFEALCRWNSAELGHIPPDRFIPIAEQTGLISEIGRRIMHEALIQARGWADSGRHIGIAVNISPMQFMRPDFTQVVSEALAETGFPPALLELEITEGIFIRDLNLAGARIRELQRLGLSIALDDFGTGYSSLSYLQRMPIDAVKLDRSFVSDLTTESSTVSMVRSVLAMAAALKLRVVTEGVETEQQLQILRDLGCEEAQGYLLGRPESAELALQRVLESPLHPIGTLV